MFELPPLLLALAFIAVGAAAWFLGRRTAGRRAVACRTVRLPRDYYVGLDHLINDRFDHAAEIFARMAHGDGETAEIQLALGSLFRRRGELDRAIAIHTRLMEHGGRGLRDKAAFALALDYFSAGLMDRAEALLTALMGSPEHRAAAQDRLLRVYESQSDWGNALKIFHELPERVQLERRRVAAHYLCELAERALDQGDGERARVLLGQARAHDPGLPRADILDARLTELSGEYRGAVRLYLAALEVSPELALEVVPRLLAIARRQGGIDPLGELTGRLRQTGGLSSRQLLWLLITALPREEVHRLPVVALDLGQGADSVAEAASLRMLLRRIGDAGGRYQCEDCGLHSVGWFWRCPKCRSWDSMRPALFKWAERADETVEAG
jgi:lipopolysaccharide biosynthesis regulator YciM